MRIGRAHLLFVVMCVVWGSTWIAAKAGISVVPPGLFVGTRFMAAGALMLGRLAARGQLPRFARADLPALAVMTVLMITACYALLFWGAQFVSSGVAAILNLALLPVALLSIGVLLGEERFTVARIAGIGTGVGGLALLFGPKLAHDWNGHRSELLGAGAIVVSALIYSLGSVLARPLLRRYSPAGLSGVTMLAGGCLLVALALPFEPGARAALSLRWGEAAWGGWVFLVLFGSLVGYTIFLDLVREWGPSAAGSYAFVSPVVAVMLGLVVFRERVSLLDLAGMAAMLSGAVLSLRPASARPELAQA